MKLLRNLGLVVVIGGAAALTGSIVVPSVYASKAKLIQRMLPTDPDVAALTGEIGTPIGEPQRIIIEDPAAYLPGTTKDGARLVNDEYLKRKGIYPLQLKTVSFVASLVRLASIGALIAGAMAILFAKSRLAKQESVSSDGKPPA